MGFCFNVKVIEDKGFDWNEKGFIRLALLTDLLLLLSGASSGSYVELTREESGEYSICVPENLVPLCPRIEEWSAAIGFCHKMNQYANSDFWKSPCSFFIAEWNVVFINVLVWL